MIAFLAGIVCAIGIGLPIGLWLLKGAMAEAIGRGLRL